MGEIYLKIRRGTEAKNSKLDDDKVREIRKLIAAGKADYQIAPKYGVRPSTIWRIRSGNGWRHVQ